MLLFLSLRQGAEQLLDLHAVVAGEDLADLPLLGRAVDLLDDRDEIALGVADDPAVAGGVIQHGRRHAGGGLLLAVGLEQRLQHLAADQRAIAGQDEHIAVDLLAVRPRTP